MKTKQTIHNLFNNPLTRSLRKGIVMGIGFALGFFATTLLAVAVTGTIKTWTNGEALTATDLNTTVTSLKTAIEGIPEWTKSGDNAVYTDGNVGIGTSSPGSAKLNVRSTSSQFVLFETNNSFNELQFNQSNSDFFQLGIEGSSAGSRMQGTIANSGYLGMYSNRALTLHTNGQQRLYIAPAGNVGIGTFTPATTLDVNGSIYSKQLGKSVVSDNRTATGTWTLSYTVPNSNVSLALVSCITGGNTQHRNRLYLLGGNSYTKTYTQIAVDEVGTYCNATITSYTENGSPTFSGTLTITVTSQDGGNPTASFVQLIPIYGGP